VPELSSETEKSIALLCQLYSTRYTAIQIKICLKSTFVNKVAAMKNMDDFCSQRKLSHATTKPICEKTKACEYIMGVFLETKGIQESE